MQVVFRYSEGSTEEMLCRITKCTKQPFPFNMPGFCEFLPELAFAFEGSTTEPSANLTGGSSTLPLEAQRFGEVFKLNHMKR